MRIDLSVKNGKICGVFDMMIDQAGLKYSMDDDGVLHIENK